MIPVVVGIVNITQDSFSDGGRFLDPKRAIEHANQLLADGAGVLELGPASSNPDAATVPAEVQIERLAPVLEALDGRMLSADVTTPAVQDFVLDRVHFLNDIQGFPDPTRYSRLADATCSLVVVHSVVSGEKAAIVNTAPATIFDRVCRFFDTRATAIEKSGVARSRLILDPGMGFFLGSDPAVSTTMLQRTQDLKRRFDLPVMISVSRKSFLRRIVGRSAADVGAATLAAELFAASEGADYVRTHDVAALVDALRVQTALSR